MKEILAEIRERGLAMQTKRPADMDSMRQRMGARDQNGSIAIYAYVDISCSSDVLYHLEKGFKKEENDLATLINVCSEWLSFLADRINRYYHFYETDELTCRAVEALKKCATREEAYELIQAVQHYYSQLHFWIDLEIPWSAVCEAYAKAMNDPAPRKD